METLIIINKMKINFLHRLIGYLFVELWIGQGANSSEPNTTKSGLRSTRRETLEGRKGVGREVAKDITRDDRLSQLGTLEVGIDGLGDGDRQLQGIRSACAGKCRAAVAAVGHD